jgi:DnaK suppressor protein
MDREELTTAQTEELHADLLALRELLDGQLEASAGDDKVVDLDAPIGRLTRMDAMQQQKMAAEERRRRQVRHQQVAAALSAIESGEYGDCRRCGEPVGYGRLKARPESPFCVPCMSELERR